MLHRRIFFAISCFGVALVSPAARADYPIVSQRYLADPGSLVFKDRVYLYNSNDDDNPVDGGYSMHSVVCVSSTDMKNWTDHGVVFEVPTDASWASDSWAPQAVALGDEVYLYFGNSGNGVGVAKSADPTGGFEDAKGSALVTSSTPGASGQDSWLFDPGVLIDDDGRAYLAFGGNGETNARVIELGADLASVNGSAAQVTPTGFFEASFLFKRNDIYYYAYSSDSSHGLTIDYLMSSTGPMSGYKYAGTIAGQPPSNDNNNNHASEFVYQGQWYHAYHNRIVATDAKISTTYRRNLGIELLDFNADGTIQEVKYTTDGVPQVGHLDPYVRVEAETTNAQQGIETEPCNDGGMDVTDLDDGDWIRVRGVDFGTAGATAFHARVASTKTGGSIELHLGSVTGTTIATCSVPNTGAAQAFMETSCAVTGAAGVNDLYLVFHGTGSDLFQFDSWQFIGGDSGSSGSGGLGGQGGTAGVAGSAGTENGGVPGTGGEMRGGAGNAAAGTGGAGRSGAGFAGGAPVAGAPGSGGAASNRGGAPSAGSSGAATSTGTGGLSGGGAGGMGGFADNGLDTPPAAGSRASGCGCSVERRSRPTGFLALAVFLAFAAPLRRRRRPSPTIASRGLT